MADFNVIVREEPSGTADFLVDLDSEGLFVATMSIDGHVNRTRTIPTNTSGHRGWGFYPIVGRIDGFETP